MAKKDKKSTKKDFNKKTKKKDKKPAPNTSGFGWCGTTTRRLKDFTPGESWYFFHR